MNLRETCNQVIMDSGLYAIDLSWEQDWGIVKEITDWIPEHCEPLKPNERLYKVADNWRKRAGYMKVDENRNELDFYPVIIH